MEAQLATFAELLRSYAPRLNLISPRDLVSLEERHLADSLRLAPLLHELPPGPLIDVGSGAGFPGVPLAIAEPARSWVLVEPRQRRAAFLEEVVRQLELDASVVCARAENLAAEAVHREIYAMATARALAEPTLALTLIQPFVKPSGTAAVFIGEQAAPPRGSELWAPGIAIVRPRTSEEG